MGKALPDDFIADAHQACCSRPRACAHPGAGGLHTANPTNHQYRSKVEILRDFLSAVREAEKKTRIIGLANLNPSSFQPYLDFCLVHELVQGTSAGYRLTPRANGVLEAIQRLIARSAEVDAALVDLHRGLDASHSSARPTKHALRYVSGIAWNELVRTAAVSLAAKTELLEGQFSVDLPTTTTPAWFDRAVATELGGPVIASRLLSGPDLSSRRRSPRTDPRE